MKEGDDDFPLRRDALFHVVKYTPVGDKKKKPDATPKHLTIVFLSRLALSGLVVDERAIRAGFYRTGETRRDTAEVCHLIYAVYIHFRMRGPFKDAIKHLKLGTPWKLSDQCERIAGVSITDAHEECMAAGSILPFMDRCIPYFAKTNGHTVDMTQPNL